MRECLVFAWFYTGHCQQSHEAKTMPFAFREVLLLCCQCQFCTGASCGQAAKRKVRPNNRKALCWWLESRRGGGGGGWRSYQDVIRCEAPVQHLAGVHMGQCMQHSPAILQQGAQGRTLVRPPWVLCWGVPAPRLLPATNWQHLLSFGAHAVLCNTVITKGRTRHRL